MSNNLQPIAHQPTTYTVAISPSSFGDADPAPLKRLESAGVVVKENPFKRRLTEEEIIEHLKGVDGLLAGLEPLNRQVLESSELKALARVGIGMANVDEEAAKELGIVVSNTPDGPTQAVSEMCLTALLCLLRDLCTVNANLHKGEWDKRVGRGVQGLKILCIGFGRIGRATATLYQSLGGEILVYDPFLDSAILPEGVRSVRLEEGLAQADVVSLHAAGEEQILGEKEFSIIKEGAILLNSARAELVGEQALLKALDGGQVEAAWFDVLWQEPYSGVLCNYPQVLLTPHISTYTRQCRLNMEMEAVENVLRDLGVKS